MLTNCNDVIAVLDSGIGGISVLRQLIKCGGDYIYFADNDYMPYGTKRAEELRERLDRIINTLIERYKVKKIIIACNTASTLVQDKYPKVITMRFDTSRTYFATNLTKKTLKNYNIIADNNLASLIERHIFDKKALHRIIKRHIKTYQLHKLDEFVLGCTHYELVKDIFEKYCPNTRVYSNSEFVLQGLEQEHKPDTNIYFITTKLSSEYNRTLEHLIKGE